MADQANGFLSGFLRYQRIRAALPFLTNGMILDYGCGVGHLARFVSPERYLGVDQDIQSLYDAKRNHPKHEFVTANELVRKSIKVDVVVGLAFIEHLKEPGKWFEFITGSLVKDGRIVLTTPHPKGRRIHEWGGKIGLFSQEAAEEHETLLTEDSLTTIARGAGFKIVKAAKFLAGFNQLFILMNCK